MTDRFSVCPRCLLGGPDNEPCPCQMTPEQREIRSLRKRLAEAEQRAERAEKELADESAKAAAAVGYGSDDALWRPGETAIDALIRERDAAELQAEQLQRELDQRAQVARVERQLRLRAERELERWRLRLRDRSYRRTHGVPIDWLADRSRVLADEPMARVGGVPTWKASVMAHLRERVRLPGDSWAVLIVCDQTIQYLTADGQETSIHAKAHLFDNRQGAESALREHLARIGLDETWGAVEYVPDAASFVAREDTW